VAKGEGREAPRGASRGARAILWFTCAAAFVVFCVVQDRLTAEGARRYVALQKDALAGRGPAVTIDEVMKPTVARSVRLAFLSSGAVAAAGVAAGLAVREFTGRSGRPGR
jgi:hypothetical protein